jgi:hypothetical protein
MMDAVSNRAMKICSMLSLIATFLLMLVFCARRELLKRNFLRIVLYTVICDFFASFSGLIGLQTAMGAKCDFQWFFSNYFMLASRFFCMIIILELYYTVVVGKSFKNYKKSMIVCIGLPLLATLLPLSTEKVGLRNPEGDWCYLVPRSGKPRATYSFWLLFSNYSWVWIMIVLMLFVFICVYLKMRNSSSEFLRVTIYGALKKLAMYPVTTILVWMPISYCDTYYAIYREESSYCWNTDSMNILCYGFPFLTGSLTVIIFVFTNTRIFIDFSESQPALEHNYGDSDPPAPLSTSQSASQTSSPLGVSSITTSDDRESSLMMLNWNLGLSLSSKSVSSNSRRSLAEQEKL